MKELKTIREKAEVIWDILEKKGINKGVFPDVESVIYDLGLKLGDLYGRENLSSGDFISSGMIRVVYEGSGNFTVLIDLMITL